MLKYDADPHIITNFCGRIFCCALNDGTCSDYNKLRVGGR